MGTEELQRDIALARRGDRNALDRVLSGLQSRLRGAAANQLGTPLRARMATSDLLQSTYLDVVRSIRSFEGDDADTLVAWILRIMENNLRDRLRFYGRDRRNAEVQQGDEGELPANTPTPSVRAMQLEHLALVGRALTDLPEDQRRVLQLRVAEGRDYDEIARLLDRSPGALRMLLSRARATLTLRLDGLLHGDA